MRKTLISLLFNFLSNPLRGINSYRQASMDLARLRISLLYVKSIETFRLLFVSLLGMGLCMIFLITGLVLFHLALLVYTPWTNETKMYVGFACAGVYFLLAAGIVTYIFSQANWLKIFHAEDLVNNLTSEEASEEKGNKNGDKYSENAAEAYHS